MKYKIKAEWNYYSGTLNVRKDGYLYDNYYTPNEHFEFDTVQSALNYLQEEYNCDFLNRDSSLSFGGTYVCAHGQHSRPSFTIVNSKSGKINKQIKKELERLV
jgi:hypothetical protein